MTPFIATAFFPLQDVDVREMVSQGWRRGPAYADWPPLAGDRRTAFYRQPRQVEDLLSPENRIHRMHRFGPNHLETVAQEVVRVADAPGEPAYLLVHLESKAASPQPTALRELAELVRPNREESKEFLRRLAPDGAWSMRPSMRVPTLSLSEAPQPGEPSNLEWSGGDPGELRLLDLLVLRTDAAHVERPFETPTQRPTPSHVLATSGTSVSVLRLRPGRDYQAARLRTTWTDAFLLELLQFDEAHTFVTSVSDLVSGARRNWEDLEQDFRTWRTCRAWIASIEHPMESAIARAVRHELATDALVERVEKEIESNADARRLQEARRLNGAVLLLTVAATVSPLLLHLAANDNQTQNPWFLASAGIAVAVLLSVLLILGRGSLRR